MPTGSSDGCVRMTRRWQPVSPSIVALGSPVAAGAVRILYRQSRWWDSMLQIFRGRIKDGGFPAGLFPPFDSK